MLGRLNAKIQSIPELWLLCACASLRPAHVRWIQYDSTSPSNLEQLGPQHPLRGFGEGSDLQAS